MLTLPEGEWRRRMRRGAQELAPLAREVDGQFEFLIVSDMLDLAAFLALTRPRFERVPVLAYFHENQMTYPRLKGTKFNSWFGQINYMTALSADAVAFNSEFHRGDFLRALRSLLQQPNNWLVEDAVGAIEARSSVLPVGVDLRWAAGAVRSDADGPRTILWNHRWEFDKAPELFNRTLHRLKANDVPFRVVVLGEQGDNPAEAITSLQDAFPAEVVHFGYAESRADYERLLRQSDIVVSTTRHEFFGVGMVEAMAAGCIPCAPNRYNYPALVPEELHGQLLWENETEFAAKLEALLTGPLPKREPLIASALRFDWAPVAPRWDEAIERLVND